MRFTSLSEHLNFMHFYTSKQLSSEDCLFAFIYIQFAGKAEKKVARKSIILTLNENIISVKNILNVCFLTLVRKLLLLTA